MGPINLTDPVETAEQKRSSSSVMQLHAEAHCESEDIPVPSQDLSLDIILMQTVQASHFAALSCQIGALTREIWNFTPLMRRVVAFSHVLA